MSMTPDLFGVRQGYERCGQWIWGAHAPRVLAMAPPPSRTFLPQSIAARRRNEHARARALPRKNRACLQSQNVAHVIKACRFPYYPLRCSQGAARECFAAARPMSQLDPLTLSGKNYRMIAHHIAAANGMNANLRFLALANHSFAPVPQFFCVAGPLQNFCQRFRRSAWRIFLQTMMRLHNFEVEIFAQNFCRLFCQRKKCIHPDAEI